LPGRKTPYRLYGKEGFPILDLMISDEEEPPKQGEKILCRHPLNPEKRVYVIPERVEPLHYCFWDGKRTISEEPLGKIREYSLSQLASLREDHLRTLNPTPYKVSVSDYLYNKMYELRQKETPIETIG
jgi:nicotinate phosphoribosyltransferase